MKPPGDQDNVVGEGGDDMDRHWEIRDHEADEWVHRQNEKRPTCKAPLLDTRSGGEDLVGEAAEDDVDVDLGVKLEDRLNEKSGTPTAARTAKIRE